MADVDPLVREPSPSIHSNTFIYRYMCMHGSNHKPADFTAVGKLCGTVHGVYVCTTHFIVRAAGTVYVCKVCMCVLHILL